jgi:hypothetical protein
MERTFSDKTPINFSIESIGPGRCRLTITLMSGEANAPYVRIDLPIEDLRDVGTSFLAFFHLHQDELHNQSTSSPE